MEITPVQFPEVIVDRFWKKVNKTHNDACWLWTASLRAKGYGAFTYRIDGVLIQDRAHRFSYMLHIGPIPEGMFVLHECDVPACVNPNHLFLGTNLDNVKDMVQKGRHVPGGTHCGKEGKWKREEQHWACKLNKEIVRAIRADYESGLYSYSGITEKYGLGSVSHAADIITKRIWKHV